MDFQQTRLERACLVDRPFMFMAVDGGLTSLPIHNLWSLCHVLAYAELAADLSIKSTMLRKRYDTRRGRPLQACSAPLPPSHPPAPLPLLAGWSCSSTRCAGSTCGRVVGCGQALCPPPRCPPHACPPTAAYPAPSPPPTPSHPKRQTTWGTGARQPCSRRLGRRRLSGPRRRRGRRRRTRGSVPKACRCHPCPVRAWSA